MNALTKTIIGIVVYVCISFLTFGYSYNSTQRECAKKPDRYCSTANVPFHGFLWPIYWGGHAGIYLTK